MNLMTLRNEFFLNVWTQICSNFAQSYMVMAFVFILKIIQKRLASNVSQQTNMAIYICLSALWL